MGSLASYTIAIILHDYADVSNVHPALCCTLPYLNSVATM